MASLTTYSESFRKNFIQSLTFIKTFLNSIILALSYSFYNFVVMRTKKRFRKPDNIHISIIQVAYCNEILTTNTLKNNKRNICNKKYRVITLLFISSLLKIKINLSHVSCIKNYRKWQWNSAIFHFKASKLIKGELWSLPIPCAYIFGSINQGS